MRGPAAQKGWREKWNGEAEMWWKVLLEFPNYLLKKIYQNVAKITIIAKVPLPMDIEPHVPCHLIHSTTCTIYRVPTYTRTVLCKTPLIMQCSNDTIICVQYRMYSTIGPALCDHIVPYAVHMSSII